MVNIKMVETPGVAIHPDEIVDCLKKDIQFKEVCQKIWRQRIIHQTAQANELTVTAESIQADADRLRHQQRLERAADTLAWLEDQMITPEDWEAGICDRLLSKQLAQHLFGEEVEKVFVQSRLDFDQVSLYQIIVPYQQLVQELFYQIEENEISFYEAAHLYDIDAERRCQCGYEGKLYRWSLKPAIATAVFAANPKEVIRPIQTEQGYHLLLVEEFMPAQLTPDVYQSILDTMFDEWLAGELMHLIHS